MSVKLNASTTSGLVVDSDLTGSLKLQTSGNDALTVDSSQVVNFTKQFQMGGVLPPAFSAYLNTAQSVSNNTFTKLQAGTEEFDTSSSYDASTNYRFTPTVAGYYQISGCIAFNATSGINSNSLCTIYKNGSRFKDGNLSGVGSAGTLFYSVVSALVYLNGSTDYVELWGLLGGTGTLTFSVNSGTNTYFQGVLVRSV